MTAPLRVLLIVNHFPPDVNPSGRLMSQLAESLRQLGLSVDVLTSFPHYQGFRIADTHRRHLMQVEQVGSDTVTRVWVFASGRKHDMRHRLANYLSFSALATLAALFRRKHYDVVLANSGSFFTGISAWLIQSMRGTPFIYNVQDIYPDIPARAGQLTNARAIALLERIAGFMYRHARKITVISEEQRRVLIGKGVRAQNVVVIPNFVDTGFVRPLPKDSDFSREHGLNDKFVVAYAGNLGFAYDFDSLLQCAAALQTEEDIVFVIIGDGVRKEEIRERIDAQALRNVRLLPFQPEQRLPEARAAADVQLSLYRKQAAQSSLPSKLYEIMASGRPAIVSAEPETDARAIIERSESGLCIDPENLAQLRHAVLRLRNDRALAKRLGDNGRRAAVELYSRDVAARKYYDLLTISVDKRDHAAQ